MNKINRSSIDRFLLTILPFVGIGVFLVLLVVGIVIFSYLFIIGSIVGVVLFCVLWVYNKFKSRKRPSPITGSQPPPSKPGRTIDHQ